MRPYIYYTLLFLVADLIVFTLLAALNIALVEPSNMAASFGILLARFSTYQILVQLLMAIAAGLMMAKNPLTMLFGSLVGIGLWYFGALPIIGRYPTVGTSIGVLILSPMIAALLTNARLK